MEPIIPQLPFYPDPEEFPDGLVGSQVVGIGTVGSLGALVIDYLVPGESEPRRIVLAFSDVGMWIQHD